MGRKSSKIDTKSKSSDALPSRTVWSNTKQPTWRSTLHDTRNTFGSSAAASNYTSMDNIFVPIQQDDILPQTPISQISPVAKTWIEDDEDRTLETNKFYANAFLGKQGEPIWTHPYQLWWGKGNSDVWNGTEKGYPTWGLCIAHIQLEDIEYPDDSDEVVKAYWGPPKKQSLMLSAKELDGATTLTTDTLLPFSVNLNLNHPSSPTEPMITFPLVQGMSFVTGGYRNATPVIQCAGRGFRAISKPQSVGKSTKFRLEDSDGRNWLAYVNACPDIVYDANAFRQLDAYNFIGPPGFKGTIQIAKNPLSSKGEAIYDKATGTFVTEANLTATVNDARGSYSLSYTKVGSSPLLVFALPHHIQSLDPDLRNNVTGLQLRTSTKGMATAIWTNRLTLVEANLPITMGFAPWSPSLNQSRIKFSQPTLDAIGAAAERDLNLSMTEKTPDDSMYYAGKVLAKFATVVWIYKEVLNNNDYKKGLDQLKINMDKYVQNRQKFPLFYDDSWKGLISNAGFSDPGADFGNMFYNDHHYHYGYFIYASAVIATLDPDWLRQGTNKQWTNSLVMDIAESNYAGRDYPFSRSFDWYMGHSWATGLYERADGKDEESTSEDGFASFAIKMWGKAIGDENMEKRGNLMLAIQARSFSNYFYLQSNNTNHPPRFINNSVTGILFENKVDHTTYFGNDEYLVHGIHMLPISPASAFHRSRTFVKEEWDRFFSNDRAMQAQGGWRGVLMANLALVDPRASWEFFVNGVGGKWDDQWIDNGASRSWYLVWAASLRGAR